jgi:hypothetical protein
MEGKKAATDPKTERYSIAEILFKLQLPKL